MLRKALPPRWKKQSPSHICLSCQRRLARPVNPSSSYAHAYAYAPKSLYSTDSNPDPDIESSTRSTMLEEPTSTSTSTSTSAYVATSNSSSNHNDTNPSPNVKRRLVPLIASPSRSRWSNQAEFALNPNARTYKMLEEPTGDIFGQRMLKYRETEELDTKTFGEPSKIIVLRQSKIKKYAWEETRNTMGEHLGGSKEPVDLDSYILDRLDAERGLPSVKEVADNIENFKPKKGEEPRDREQWNHLIQQIQESFTTPQLLEYIEYYKGERISELDPAATTKAISSSQEEEAKILRQSPWVTELFNTDEYFDSGSKLRGYALASHTSKQKVVIRLLRECWELVLPDVENSIGLVEIAIRPHHLELLLRSDLFPLLKEGLGRAGEDIETFPSTGVVKITTTRRRYKPVIKRIESELKNIRILPISLSDLLPSYQSGGKLSVDKIQEWAASQFDDEALLEISRLTDTKITKMPQNTSLAKRQVPISIACLLTPTNPWKFTRAQQARRLLLSSCNLAFRTQRSLGCRSLPENQPGSFVEYGLDTGLPWRERLRKWTRFSAPIGKDNDSEVSCEVFLFQNPKELASIDKAKDGDDQPSTVSKSAPKSVAEGGGSLLGSDYWSDQYSNTSEAILGAVLHTDLNSLDGVPKAPVGSPEIIHAFSPTLPTITKLIQNMKKPRDTSNDSLVLRFQPNPFFVDPVTKKTVGADVISAFPPLEMVFDAVPNHNADYFAPKDLFLRSVDAVVEEKFTDIMLPDQAVDVRLKQRRTSRLRSRKLAMPQITEYLQFSTLQAGPRRLDLPPTLTMPIAKHLCNLPALAKLNRNPEDEIHQVEYIFVDRQFRTGISLLYNNWRVAYTYINAGTDGKRSELTIKPINRGTHATKQEYINTVFELAESFGKSAFSVRRVMENEETAKLVKFVTIKEEKEGPMPTMPKYTAFRPRDYVKDGREESTEN
ncbi:hypothetical protein HYALB_00008606 [Hymenoscyphus albidus]|uniref:Uncharacterized protein n=1 Tax=Hymenoscyphus albidus TaxID=595503 RepID=A0A9N9PQA9_9HELO|nr:hypothetical protein HYALB_00008606 [Hymenoscyphus albidus]